MIIRRIFKTICILLLIGVVIYIFSLLSVCTIIHEVKDVFDGKVSKSETDNTPLELYNYYHDRLKSNYVIKTSIRPIFVIKNWERGTILVRYEYWVYDEEGKILWGFANRFPVPPSRWTIEKIDGKWKITDIFEAP